MNDTNKQPVEFTHEHHVVLKIMASLATLLDEDQFAHIEQIALRAGVNPPSNTFLFGGRVKSSPSPEHGRLFAELMDGNRVAACVYGGNRNELFQRIAALNVSQLSSKQQAEPVARPFVWWSDASREVWVTLEAGRELKHDERDAYLSSVEISGAIPLYTQPPAVAVPDGYALVPVEPTREMLDAAERIDWSNADIRGNCCNQWHALLAAAQEAKP